MCSLSLSPTNTDESASEPMEMEQMNRLEKGTYSFSMRHTEFGRIWKYGCHFKKALATNKFHIIFYSFYKLWSASKSIRPRLDRYFMMRRCRISFMLFSNFSWRVLTHLIFYRIFMTILMTLSENLVKKRVERMLETNKGQHLSTVTCYQRFLTYYSRKQTVAE